jgi:hypothetical protein
MIFKVINTFTVLAYGIVIMFTFIDIGLTKKNIIVITVTTLVLSSIQVAVFLLLGPVALLWLYPLIIHLPLILIFVLLYRKSWSTSLLVMLLAYMLTEPRNWLGDFIYTCIPNYPNIKDIVKSAVTLPLLCLICRFLSPKVRLFLSVPDISLRYVIWPAGIYYVVIYATTVYSDWLYRQSSFAVSGMLSACVIIFIFFSVLFYEQLFRNSELEKEHSIISVQSKAIADQLEEMASSREKLRELRHDMRHYLELIRRYAVIGKIDEINKLISEAETGIDSTQITSYCTNESVNLLLSAYAVKAAHAGITVNIKAEIPSQLDASVIDICAILANGIEKHISLLLLCRIQV